MQVLDGLTASRMMTELGLQSELNPLVRHLFDTGGLVPVLSLKLAVVFGVLPTLVWLGIKGRLVLARACLAVALCVGVIGTLSNVL